MKIVGFVLTGLAVLLIVVPVVMALQSSAEVWGEVFLVVVMGLGLLVAGSIVYGLGRAVEELTLIRKYLKRQHYSDSARAADLTNQIADRLREMGK